MLVFFAGNRVKRKMNMIENTTSPNLTGTSSATQAACAAMHSESAIEISRALLTVRRRSDLQLAVKGKVCKLLGLSDCDIFVFSEQEDNFENFLNDAPSQPGTFLRNTTGPKKYSGNEVHRYSAYPHGFEKVVNLADAGSDPAEHVRLRLASGAAALATVVLADQEGLRGVVYFYAESPAVFSEEVLALLRQVAALFTIVVENILAAEAQEQQYIEKEILLSLSAAVDKVKDRTDLVYIIREKLTELVSFTDIALTTYHADTRTFQVFAHQVNEKMGGHPKFVRVIEPEYPVEDGIHEIALNASGPVIVDIEDAMRSPNKHAGTQFIYESGIKKMLLIKLTSNNRPIGFLNILSSDPLAFNRVNYAILKGITDQLSNAIVNIMAREESLRRDQENEVLLAISAASSSGKSIKDIMQLVYTKLATVTYFNDIYISQYHIQKNTYRIVSCVGDLLCPEFDFMLAGEHVLDDEIQRLLMRSDETVCLSFDQLKNMNMPYTDLMIQAGIRECACIRLTFNDEIIGALTLTSDKRNGFNHQDRRLIRRLSDYLATGLSNIIAREKLDRQLEEIKKYKEQLEEANGYLQEEANEGYTYDNIIGGSPEMRKVFHLLSQVSFTNSTVLLLGETGTGKEMIARAIHNSSARKEMLMVKVNCAALPANLIESELFGHERGSFTGATERRVGKFELADKGTLFLDEIGEMPLDLQTKLLRAIQEREIERVGGRDPIKVDVRIIAATNRNLLNEVNEGRFRSDLYYRLNVFPITLPPLRSRKEDIPGLASYFVGKFAKSNGRKAIRISSHAMKELVAYNWPGNVRELEHLIERSVLLASGNVIREMHLPGNKPEDARIASEELYNKTHEENERDYIVAVLNKCNGKIYGVGGAAQILGLKVGTLNSKIKKLGIRKEQIIFQKK